MKRILILIILLSGCLEQAEPPICENIIIENITEYKMIVTEPEIINNTVIVYKHLQNDSYTQNLIRQLKRCDNRDSRIINNSIFNQRIDYLNESLRECLNETN